MRIADIQYNDITNGEGIVLSLWLQGCPHKCNGCHNQETWDFEKEENLHIMIFSIF
nr:4Fe-4S cluster-binding domain-containing protein [Clostridioides mangenotii]